MSAARRPAAFPHLPTLAESGVPNYEMTSWYGMLAPCGTPRAVIERLNTAIVSAQKEKPIVDTLASEGAELEATTPQQFAGYLKAEMARYAALRIKLDLRLK